MANITTKTPIRLQDPVCEAFAQEYELLIEEHGASHAVNVALALHLRRRGYDIPDLETPSEKIASAQAKRWQSVKAADSDAQVELERKRELKRKRDARYRTKKRIEKKLSGPKSGD